MPTIQYLSEVNESFQWEQDVSSQRIERIINRIVPQSSEDGNNDRVELTALQREALNHTDFNSRANLIIQGSASAGKTLVSEISIIDVLDREGKVIVLVPQGTNVREHARQLESDLNIAVCRSYNGFLGDYGSIFAGTYVVAVVDYETYSTFLAQEGCNILNDCNLVVVDELPMCGEGRENIENALRQTLDRNQNSRIVCLATSGGGVSEIQNNLNAEIIRCPIERLDDVSTVFKWNPESNSNNYIRRIKERFSGSRGEGCDSVELTALQRETLNHPSFRSPDNLIIQGATSAGKTLVSEISIIDVLANGGKVIFLVPLKAMVRERAEQLKRDLDGCRVYGSSKDFMEHDGHIIDGEYDVAVIVYEKYFAFLNQGSKKMLEHCKLVVVDEISMINKEERGPKLETALMITKIQYPEARIICLATSDCKINKIASWLGAKIIRCPLRPIALEEHIVNLFTGIGKKRYIPSEDNDDNAPEEDFKLEICDEIPPLTPGDEKKRQEREKKCQEALLTSVVRKIYDDDKNAKVLVFIPSRQSTKDYSKFLKDELPNIFREIAENTDEKFEKTMRDIEACEDDDDRDTIKNLMRHGVAYHSATLSVNLREIIELEFQRIDSPVKVVVATETLTIGVNMPFDVMIILDSKVPRGNGVENRESLTNQEYRNYIGRAGRLGLCQKPGKTYLFVRDEEEFNNYWEGYCRNSEEVKSALVGEEIISTLINRENSTREKFAKEILKNPLYKKILSSLGFEKPTEAHALKLCVSLIRAPFYLSLLKSHFDGGFTDEDVKSLYEKSLPHIFEENGGAYEFEASWMLEVLREHELVVKNSNNPYGFSTYNLTRFGRQIAPYALSMDTSYSIYRFFVEDGLPAGISQQDLYDDRYLLEILIHICYHVEVGGHHSLLLPGKGNRNNDNNRNREAQQKFETSVLDCLNKKMMQENFSGEECKHKYWTDNTSQRGIYRIWKGGLNILEDSDIHAAMRAILMYYWTQGYSRGEILQNTGFNLNNGNCTSGDMERLAEVISHHLDAIHSCLDGWRRKEQDYDFGEYSSYFYSLQTRVKYGMSRGLVVLANKHVRGLDRAKLLKFGKKANQEDKTPQELLYELDNNGIRDYMTENQRDQLKRRIGRSEFNDLCEKVLKTDTTEDEVARSNRRFIDNLRSIWRWDGQDVNTGFFQPLSVILGESIPGGGLISDQEGCYSWNYQSCGKIAFSVVNSDGAVRNINNEYLASEEFKGKIHIVHVDEETDRTTILNNLGGSYDLALSNKALAWILLQAFLEEEQKAYVLFQFLADAYGNYLDSYVNLSMKNYLPQELTQSNPNVAPYYLLTSRYDGSYGRKTGTQIESELRQYQTGKECCVVPWGDKLQEATDNGWFSGSLALVYLNRDDIIHSKSLTNFMFRKADTHFDNCYALFGSEHMENTWYDKKPGDGGHVLQWNPKNVQIWRFNSENHGIIGEFVKTFTPCSDGHKWKIAISYGHYFPLPENGPGINDPEGTFNNAIQQLDTLVETLKEEFGEYCIFYDRIEECNEQFAQAQAKSRSLYIYRNCKIGLFLSNYWTINNANCKDERNEVIKSFNESRATYLFLTTKDSDDWNPDIDGEFKVDISHSGTIIKRIRKFLAEHP